LENCIGGLELEREELQQEIRKAMDIIEKYEGMVEQANRMIIKYQPTYLKRIVLICLCIAFQWINNNFTFTGSTVFDGIFLAIKVGIPIYIVIRIVAYFKYDSSNEKAKVLIKEADDFLEDSLESSVKLPRNYCNTKALERFTYYLDNFIAENLKECAVHYHSEQENEKLFNEIESLKGQVSEAKSASYLAAKEAAAARISANYAASAAEDTADVIRDRR
jgi:cell division septum initiation protein DivIVA